jgi:hypothetical protein
MSVDVDHGAGYGNTLTWGENDRPEITVRPVEVQMDLDKEKFYRMFAELMTTPGRYTHLKKSRSWTEGMQGLKPRILARVGGKVVPFQGYPPQPRSLFY